MKSLAGQFLDFCRSKPADEEYNFSNRRGCAIFQFLEASGYPVECVGGTYWTDKNGKDHPLPPPLYWPELGTSVVVQYPWAFGALASRLEASAHDAAALQAIEEMVG